MYWSKTMRYFPLEYVLPLKRFDKVKRFLHFVENPTFDESIKDKLLKIRPVVESVRQQCLQVLPEELHSIR